MKLRKVLLVLVALLFLSVGVAYACEKRPEQPACPVGTITLVPSEWVEESGTGGYWTDPICIGEEPPDDPVEPPICVPTERIWVWDIVGQDGLTYWLRDRNYDGTYVAPSLAIQRYYFGCSFYPVSVGGHWVDNCGISFGYINSFQACGGACPTE